MPSNKVKEKTNLYYYKKKITFCKFKINKMKNQEKQMKNNNKKKLIINEFDKTLKFFET